jgi:phosphoribosylamine--glycine ligase
LSFLLKDKVHEIIREQRAQRSLGPQPGPGMRCLVIGPGGREHAIAWRLLRDREVGSVDVLPGNGGTARITRNIENIPPNDPHRIAEHAVHAQIDLAIVGPDEAIAAGVADALRRVKVPAVGPSRDAGRIEWSKSYAKELMDRAGVPTAPWWTFDDFAAFEEFVADVERPLVVKVDGLAAGKGVVVADTRDEAIMAARAALVDHKFGAAGDRIVVEERLEGEEVSLEALVDAETVVALPTARDYKRALDGDGGTNTGGMGAYSPAARLPDTEAQALADRLIAPVARALAADGTPYRGILYAGAMRTDNDWAVLEYNARFGDPEAEVILPRVEGDFAALMLALAEGRLRPHLDASPLAVSSDATVDVVIAARDYPAKPKTGESVEGTLDVPEGVLLFHAGTRLLPTGALVTSGGRVLHVVGRGPTVPDARQRAYAAVERISFPSAFHRSDIGLELATSAADGERAPA